MFDRTRQFIKDFSIFISWKCGKNTESKNPKVAKTKTGRIRFLSKCTVCNSKKSRFLKEQEAKGLWDSFKQSPNPFPQWQQFDRNKSSNFR